DAPHRPDQAGRGSTLGQRRRTQRGAQPTRVLAARMLPAPPWAGAHTAAAARPRMAVRRCADREHRGYLRALPPRQARRRGRGAHPHRSRRWLSDGGEMMPRPAPLRSGGSDGPLLRRARWRLAAWSGGATLATLALLGVVLYVSL